MTPAIIAAAIFGTMATAIGGMFAVAVVAQKKRFPVTLPRSGLKPGPTHFAPSLIDDVATAQIRAFDKALGFPPGTSSEALLHVKVEFYLDALGELPHDRPKTGRAIRPNALRLEVGVKPKAKLGATAFGYECWRRLLRFHDRAEWDADNSGPNRWPLEWFSAQQSADAPFR